jgi:hypothetical protein
VYTQSRSCTRFKPKALLSWFFSKNNGSFASLNQLQNCRLMKNITSVLTWILLVAVAYLFYAHFAGTASGAKGKATEITLKDQTPKIVPGSRGPFRWSQE